MQRVLTELDTAAAHLMEHASAGARLVPCDVPEQVSPAAAAPAGHGGLGQPV